jgi:hypothetical protein
MPDRRSRVTRLLLEPRLPGDDGAAALALRGPERRVGAADEVEGAADALVARLQAGEAQAEPQGHGAARERALVQAVQDLLRAPPALHRVGPASSDVKTTLP